MSDFEKQYYESPSFWEGSALLDEGNKIRIEETIRSIPLDVINLADIGCGNGVFISKLMDLKPNIITTGLDRSHQALKYVKGEKKVGEITNLPFESNSFDCVSCLEVIEHLNVNDFKVALNELSRISRKYIIIGVPFEEKIQYNKVCCPKCNSTFNRDLHLQSFNIEKLENLFANKNFKMIKFQNVVKSNEIIGLSLFIKFKNIFSKNESIFESPICIICGYKNDSFKLDVNNIKFLENSILNLSDKYIFNKIKEFIKRILPTQEKNGYWAICLYEKIVK
jgi:ubiquinone/menaquinone biosynthesis C-methylase UbiE